MTDDTLLLRQIHPSFVQSGRVTSQAIRPTPTDEFLLSFYDGDRIEAQASWQHFVADPACRSAGVMAITRGQCLEQDLPVNADGVPFAEHVSIDFSAFEKAAIEKKAKVLAKLAQVRGWLYEADQQ